MKTGQFGSPEYMILMLNLFVTKSGLKVFNQKLTPRKMEDIAAGSTKQKTKVSFHFLLPPLQAAPLRDGRVHFHQKLTPRKMEDRAVYIRVCVTFSFEGKILCFARDFN